MKFGFKGLIVGGILAAGLGLGASAASAMPLLAAPATIVAADSAPHADKAAVVCIGRCYRRFGYARPYGVYRPYRAYRPLYRPYRYGYGYRRF